MSKFPNHILEERAIAAGAQVKCLWQTRGPKDTGVAWLECLQIGPRGDVVIVETFHHGGWNAFSAPHSNKVDDTIADVLERCGVKTKADYVVMKDGDYLPGVTTATSEKAALAAAEAQHGAGRYSVALAGGAHA